MYNNPFMNQYNPQATIDKLNEQINNLEKMKSQIQQPPQPAINQTFQLAPTNREVIRYASSMEEVQKDMVIGDTPYFSKDMSVVWIKNTKGEIRTYELNEIVPLDEKDLKIQYLETQIEELKKGMIKNVSNVTNDDEKQDTTNTTEYDESIRETIKNEKSTGISKVSGSKKK